MVSPWKGGLHCQLLILSTPTNQPIASLTNTLTVQYHLYYILWWKSVNKPKLTIFFRYLMIVLSGWTSQDFPLFEYLWWGSIIVFNNSYQTLVFRVRSGALLLKMKDGVQLVYLNLWIWSVQHFSSQRDFDNFSRKRMRSKFTFKCDK